MKEKTEQELREKLKEIRKRFLTLQNICTLQRINKATLEEYSGKIRTLENQLQKMKGGDKKWEEKELGTEYL